MTPKAKLVVDQFSVDDLVLPVSQSYDPAKLNLDAYDDFIKEVVAGRTYSYEAVRTALIFLAGGGYADTGDLAKQAFSATPGLERRYGTVGRLLARLPFPDKLACSLDLATGTGKSYVMFCIARIMLNEGLVNRVLVLCPSVTIEARAERQVRRAARRQRPHSDPSPGRTGPGSRSASTRPRPSRKGKSASRTSTPSMRRRARPSPTASRAWAPRRSCSPTRRTTSTRRAATRP